MTQSTKQIHIPDEQAMLAFGGELLNLCATKSVVYLIGDLGAGKTTLVRGFLRTLGFKGAVKSPTYTFVESYELAGKKIYHFDLYRITDPKQLEEIGIRDYFSEQAVLLIEWPERAASLLPPADITIRIAIPKNGRQIDLTITDGSWFLG